VYKLCGYAYVSGAIVANANGSTVVRNCKNYGNLSRVIEYARDVYEGVGGIVGCIGSTTSYFECKVVVENCENYGDIIGSSHIGGIVGWHNQVYNRELCKNFNSEFPDCYMDGSIIKNCMNYGNIYRDKNGEKKCISGFGGITGIGTKIENCKNSGSIYGFETVDPDWQVEYVGGICGAAVSVGSCESTGEFNVSSLVKCADSLCGYIIK